MPDYPTKHRGGRPRLDPSGGDAGSRVTAWLRPGEHDRVIARASREGKSVSAIMRELVKTHLR
jgi:hypothetical protein